MPSLLFKAFQFLRTRTGMLVATHIGLAIAVMLMTVYAMNTLHTAEKAKAAMKAEQQMKAAVERAIGQERRLREAEDEIMNDHLARLQREAEQVEVVEKEIVKYVENDDQCNLSRGAVRLLNDRRASFGQAGVAEQAAAELSDGEARTPSAFTQRAEVAAHADCIGRYNQVAGQLKGLIRWVEASREDREEKVSNK